MERNFICRAKEAGEARRYRLPVLTMTLIILSLTLAACGGDSTSSGGSSGPSNADLLKQAAANMKAATSYHLEVNADLGQGQTLKGSGDLDIAGKKSRTSVDVAGVTVDTIVIGSDTYTSADGGQTYTKSSDQSGSALDSFASLWGNFNAADIDSAKDQLQDASPATETVGGTTTKHIVANTKDLASLGTASGGMDGTLDLWISTDANPTVRQMMVKGTSNGTNVSLTITWSKINQAVEIKVPTTGN